MNWGKVHRSAFTGSMAGKGSDVFAIWCYVLAHAWDNIVDINISLVAFMIGMPEQRAREVVEFLCAEDPESRTRDEGGKRLVHAGGIRYRVVNWDLYNEQEETVDKTEKERARKARQRENNRKKRQAEQVVPLVPPVSHVSLGHVPPCPTKEEKGQDDMTGHEVIQDQTIQYDESDDESPF